MTDLVQITDEGPVRIIAMNRPDKKNALISEMYQAMAGALEVADLDSSIHCVLIKGAPGAFCAGHDFNEFLKAAATGQGLGEAVVRFLYALARADKPIVASVQGLAVGIGTTMILHCDFAVAGSDARFSTPFVPLGLVPEAASSLLAPRLMGHRRAFSLLVMGRALDAQAAKEAGLVNMVVPPEQADAEALKAAREIAALPPEAVALSRRLIRGAPEQVIERMDEEIDLFRVRLTSPEARTAFENFLNRKR